MNKNHKHFRISCENNEDYENLKIKLQFYGNNEKLRIQYDNHKTYKNHTIPLKNNKKQKILELNPRFIQIMRILEFH